MFFSFVVDLWFDEFWCHDSSVIFVCLFRAKDGWKTRTLSEKQITSLCRKSTFIREIGGIDLEEAIELRNQKQRQSDLLDVLMRALTSETDSESDQDDSAFDNTDSLKSIDIENDGRDCINSIGELTFGGLSKYEFNKERQIISTKLDKYKYVKSRRSPRNAPRFELHG